MKQRIFEILQVGDDQDKLSKIFDFFIIFLIFLNVTLLIWETFDVSKETLRIFYIIEAISVFIFTIEYILRIWTADMLYPHLTPSKARLKYAFSFMAFIDLIAFLPFYIPFIFPVDLMILRSLRTLRLFRLFKLNRYMDAFGTVSAVLKAKSAELGFSIAVVGLIMLISSVLMYNLEHENQPEIFRNAFSGLWWAAAAFTTVGYGDIVPLTGAGRILSIVISILGIGLVAVPTGIISAGFVEQISNGQEQKKCPHCGKEIS